MGLRVRKFREEDTEATLKVLNAAFHSFLGYKQDRKLYFDREFLKQQRKDYHTERIHFVASDNNRIFGYIAGTAKASGLGSLEVIAVDPEFFGANVGMRLFKALEKFWKRKKLRKVETCVSAHNKRALIFYLKNGFIPVGYRKDHFIKGVDEILLDKFLS